LTRPADTDRDAPAAIVAVLEGMTPTGEAGPASSVGSHGASGPEPGRCRLVEAVLEVARRRAEHPAIVVGSDCHSYRDVADAAHATAQFLLSKPTFTAGSRVALVIDNRAEYLAGFYGILLAGGVVVPIPPNTESSRLARILSACGVEVLLSTSPIAARLAPLGWKAYESVDLGRPSQAAPVDIEPVQIGPAPNAGRTLAMIMFTSGSTGDPKGVMLTDANLLANARSIAEYLPISGDDRALALLPFYHAYGNSVMQTHLLAGATLVVDGSLAFPNTVPEALRRHEATSFSGVPETYHLLLSYSDFGGEPLPPFQKLRYATVAGGALEPAAALEVAGRFAPAEFYVMYGQTEATARLAYLPPEVLRTHAGSIGKAIPGVELKVVGDARHAVGPGEIGELCARGPNVMAGYWDDPAATSAVITDGWLHTGDLATVDAEGYIFVESRKDDLVKTQGMRTHPREIAELVSEHFPGYRVIVVPYRFHKTTRLALYVAPGAAFGEVGEVSVGELRRFCLRSLPRPKVPSYIEVLDRVPLNASMKLDREGLVRQAERETGLELGAFSRSTSAAFSRHVVGFHSVFGQEGMHR